MRKFVWGLLVVVSVGLVTGAVEAKAGSKIAFNRGADIWLMDPDGSNQANITNSPSTTDELPTWSPDGSQIAFYRAASGGGSAIWVMEADGSNPVRLTNASPSASMPAWSPELPAQVSAISVGGTYALVFMMGVMAALMVTRQRQGIRPGQNGRLIG